VDVGLLGLQALKEFVGIDLTLGRGFISGRLEFELQAGDLGSKFDLESFEGA
jgi:hypothetical protein